ncbi:MAG: 16S rRNA processing protein RimM [Ferruginibacter sp.]|nr:16S rRNA processing protein RimM [Ferruginibacter sp.]
MQYFKIGKLAASHGITGELILQHSLGKKTLLKGVEAIFLEQPKNNFLPHFIEKITSKSDTEIYIKLEGINSLEIARKLTPKEVWLQEDDFNNHKAKAAPIALLGYNIIDGETDLGSIIEVMEMPHQILCTILYNGNEALIPIHEANLIKMDNKNKKVYVDVPDGLLEIYG